MTPPVVSVVVVVDLSDLEPASDCFSAVRRRLFDTIVDLPDGTLVRLVTGRLMPLPATADDLPIGHVMYQVESPSYRVGEAWRVLLNGLAV